MNKILPLFLIVGLIGCKAQVHLQVTSTPSPQVPVVVQPPAPPPSPPVDTMSVSVLVKKHPRLQKICDAAGGCDNVKIECFVYDNTGNTNLRGRTAWTVEADGVTGYGISPYNSPDLLGGAIVDWFDNKRIESEVDTNPDVYPHSKPCDASCVK